MSIICTYAGNSPTAEPLKMKNERNNNLKVNFQFIFVIKSELFNQNSSGFCQ